MPTGGHPDNWVVCQPPAYVSFLLIPDPLAAPEDPLPSPLPICQVGSNLG